MHWTKEASQDVIVGSILDIDDNMSRRVGGSSELEPEDVRIVDEWVDSINQEIYHAQAVADNIEVRNYGSSQELYSAVGALRDSIDQNIVEPYWQDISTRISGFENQGQLFQAQNFTDSKDKRRVEEILGEAYRDPEVLDEVDPELLFDAREKRHGILNLGEAYVHTKNVLKADEASRSEVTGHKFRNYEDSGL